jgi:hypothetical protein
MLLTGSIENRFFIRLAMKPTSSRLQQPTYDRDDLILKLGRYKKKKRQLLRRVNYFEAQVKILDSKSIGLRVARRDWMLFVLICVLLCWMISSFVFKWWLELRSFGLLPD